VTDFGCGNGTSLSWLRSEGFTAAGVEIATNAIKQNADRIHVADLRDEYTGPISEYGICTDLMEHIPTDDVPRVLANISAATKCGVLFGIARLPDKDGDAMGLTLHLTIKDREWWDEHILKYFAAVREIRYDDGVYLLWAFH
jgi:cyclopropane fatty-acyl-phospholipid synthase-like methyltransferase